MAWIFQKTNSCFWNSKEIKSFTQKGRYKLTLGKDFFILCVCGRGEEVHNCVVVFFNWGKMASCVQAVCQKLCKLWPQSRPNVQTYCTSSCNILSFLPHRRWKVLSSVFTPFAHSWLLPVYLAMVQLMRIPLKSPRLSAYKMPWIYRIKLKIFASASCLNMSA